MTEVDIKAFVHEGKYSDRFNYTETIIVRLKEPVAAAKMAIEMASRWGVVAAIPDGEDSAGRQKLALHPPKELAQRACETAAALWAEFEARGWLVDLPEPRRIASDEKVKP